MDGIGLPDLEDLLQQRQTITEQLEESPYDLILYLKRADIYHRLGYPDLTAGDAYRALLLTDEVADESFEYYEVATDALKEYTSGDEDDEASSRRKGELDEVLGENTLELDASGISLEDAELPLVQNLAKRAAVTCYRILSINLLSCGCLKSAYDFCLRGLELSPADTSLSQTQNRIQAIARRHANLDENEAIDINGLPDQGYARRELYPWNTYEPDRHSQEILDFLNSELALIAPKCEVLVTELPTLISHAASKNDENGVIASNKQLGLFAKEDILPGNTVLHETSVLTVNSRLKESLCDCCSSPLPSLRATVQAVPCSDCVDTTFCTTECHDLAQETYHPAVCDKEMDTIGKNPDPKETPNALYLLLLGRALAMSNTQGIHPLLLKEVRYIWGDFLPSTSNYVQLSSVDETLPQNWTLPFSFASNIATPLHMLEKMDIDIFATLSTHDLWIFNTLYAKFRGTASARVAKDVDNDTPATTLKIGGKVVGKVVRGGGFKGPEVAAVHPLWCLANHDCDPNVQWEWGGRMRLWAREERIGGKGGGIKKGEEILNHYCDIGLAVQERREWMRGSLGGACMCGRCRREAGEVA